MQIIRVILVLETSAYILGIEGKKHVVPTCRFRIQFGLTQRSFDGIFVVHKSDIVCFQTQTVHLQFIERQGKSRSVLLGGVRRGDEDL